MTETKFKTIDLDKVTVYEFILALDAGKARERNSDTYVILKVLKAALARDEARKRESGKQFDTV